MSVAEDQGERLFRSYLRQRPDLTAAYEEGTSGQRADFTVRSPNAEVVSEVYSPQVLLAPGAASFDSFGPLRGAFKARKRGQGAHAKSAGIPYVVVVSTANSAVPVGAFELMVAMFGDPRRIHAGQNTRFSALAVVSDFNPTAWRIDQAVAAGHAVASDDLAGAVRSSMRAIKDLTASGLYDPTARVARLEVVHNPWAAAPLPIDLFGGPHDRQYEFDATTHAGELNVIWEGWRVAELPSTAF